MHKYSLITFTSNLASSLHAAPFQASSSRPSSSRRGEALSLQQPQELKNFLGFPLVPFVSYSFHNRVKLAHWIGDTWHSASIAWMFWCSLAGLMTDIFTEPVFQQWQPHSGSRKHHCLGSPCPDGFCSSDVTTVYGMFAPLDSLKVIFCMFQ